MWPEPLVLAFIYLRHNANFFVTQDGRCPFDPEEEVSILKTLRKRESWPCFPARLAFIGKRYRSKGYHERLGYENGNDEKGILTTTTAMLDLDIDDTLTNINLLLHQLNAQDATYLVQLSGHVAGRFVNGFTLEDQQIVHDIMRYMILGRTLRCSKETLNIHEAARALCEFYFHDTIAIVFDVTAKSLTECCLAQNRTSLDVLGATGNKCLFGLGQNQDLFRLLLAVGGAYHRPGVGFTLHNQKLLTPSRYKRFNLTYLVDPVTFYMVVFGEETAGKLS